MAILRVNPLASVSNGGKGRKGQQSKYGRSAGKKPAGRINVIARARRR